MSQRVPNLFPLYQPDERIAIVGEAPGADEEIKGEPFVGQAGFLLNKTLTKVGITRQGCFIGNVCQYRPPNNQIKLLKGTPEWHQSIKWLAEDLARFDPHIIVALGDTALGACTDKFGISNWRGSVIKSKFGPKCIPTFHPASILRVFSNIPVFEFDLKKVRRESSSREMCQDVRKFYLNPSPEQAIKYLSDLQGAQKVAVDFETRMNEAWPKCLGFAPSPSEAMCIPFNSGYSPADEGRVMRAIAQFMKSPAKKVFHNALFDLGVFLYHYRITPKNFYMDTMLAWHACYPELLKSLAFITSILTTQPYYKGMHKEKDEEGNEKSWSDNVDPFKLWEYNCLDVVVTHECSTALEKELDSMNARPGYDLDMSLIPIALYMTFKGIKIDKAAAQLGFDKYEKEAQAIQVLINKSFGREINTKSPQQVCQLLYDELKLPVQLNKETKERTSDINALLKLYHLGYKQVMPLLLNRRARTMQSFFFLDNGELDKETVWKDGRIHAGFNIAGTKTGRWSSSDSFLLGRNIMNIPEECRQHFAADDGYVLVGWDKAQAEARVVAYKAWLITGDDSYKKLVESGNKVHVWFGKQLCETGVFTCTPEQVVSGTTEYAAAKQGVHANSYGEGPVLFCQQLLKKSFGRINIPVSMAKAIKEVLFTRLPAIPKWQHSIDEYLQSHKVMTNAFGRIGIFWDRFGPDLFKKYYAFDPQSTVGDDVARSIRDIFLQLPEVMPVQQNYDSFLGLVKKEQADNTLVLMKKLAEQPIQLHNFDKTKTHTLIVPVVMKVGYNWKDLQEIK